MSLVLGQLAVWGAPARPLTAPAQALGARQPAAHPLAHPSGRAERLAVAQQGVQVILVKVKLYEHSRRPIGHHQLLAMQDDV